MCPQYEYECNKCKTKITEFFHTFKESEEFKCECKCGGKLTKLISQVQPPRIGKQTGFMSNGKLIKKDKDIRGKVRDTYFGDNSDQSEFVE